MEKKELNELNGRVFSHSTELNIERVPKNLVRFIKDFAYKNCCGDYGWALSMLIGPVDETMSSFAANLQEIEFRLKQLEKKQEPEKEGSKHGRERFKEEEKNVGIRETVAESGDSGVQGKEV